MRGGDRRRQVAILAHPTQQNAVAPWLDRFARDRVHVIAPAEIPEWHLETRSAEFCKAKNLSQVSLQLKMLGPLDVIVSLLSGDRLPGGAKDQFELFQRVFRHLTRGGVYVLDRTTAPIPSSTMGVERWTRLLAAADDPSQVRTMRRRDAELARSTGTVVVSRDAILATKRLKHYVKLRDADVGQFLARREPGLKPTELDLRREQSFAGRAVVTSHGEPISAETLPGRFDVPQLTLRHYEGTIGSSGGTLLFSGHTILPDSFRWHLTTNPTNVHLTSVSPEFARIESRFLPNTRLRGSYYTVDSSNSGHFGHLTTEVISRLWGWDRAKQEIPELKALFHLTPGSTRRPRLEIELLKAFGIAESDIVWVNEPVWLESVVSATPMWHNEAPHYVHPEIATIWSRLSKGLLPAPPGPTADRLFVSRRGNNRLCRNRVQVEEFFSGRDFHVVFPELLTMAEQVAMFSGARVIAGFAGSNLFNLMHARNLETAIVLSHTSYTARNEHLITSVTGGEVHYFWSAADLPQPEEGFSKKAFFSDWEVNLDRDGDELDALIAGLPPSASRA
ncbi:MAG: glycosyltransferase family 61 protein [Nocardioidaceae bacterium]